MRNDRFSVSSFSHDFYTSRSINIVSCFVLNMHKEIISLSRSCICYYLMFFSDLATISSSRRCIDFSGN